MSIIGGKPSGYWRVSEYVKDVDARILSNLETFYFEILRYNQRLSLIPKKSELEGDIVNVLDCIIGSRLILAQSKAAVIYDLGSGNGLPGIVMALLDPQRKLVLVDADIRKVEFLKLMVTQLSLKNVAAVHKKLEDLEEGSISCAVSRGFSTISKCLLLTRKIVRLDGEFYHFKGSSWAREVAAMPSQVCTFFSPRLAGEYELPVVATKMGVICTKKISQ